MAMTTFAAIDIGSYEISMKIFEFSKKIGFRELNDVRYRLEIGKGAYSSGRLERNNRCNLRDLKGFPRHDERIWGNRLSCMRDKCL